MADSDADLVYIYIYLDNGVLNIVKTCDCLVRLFHPLKR